MTLYLLLYLYLLSVFLTFTFTLVFKNRGPWNNPMLFLLVLFMTSWTISIWLEPVSINNKSYPFLSVTAITLLISVLLAGTRTTRREKNKVRRLKDNSVVDVVTQPEGHQIMIIPNFYFWFLLMIESLLIIAAYIMSKLL